jgi:RNA polymerase sigma-70 factor (ECF subfamily)
MSEAPTTNDGPHPRPNLHIMGVERCSTQELLLLSQRGDAVAFERLYRLAEPALSRFLRSRRVSAADREEIVQEVFCRLWCSRENLAVGSSAAETYLIAVARNVHREFCRRASRDGDFGAAALGRCVAAQEPPHVVLQQNELADLLQHARGRPSSHEEAAVRLVYDGEHSPRAAAAELGCTVNALQNRLRRARAKLKKAMELLFHEGRRSRLE